jgi:uncharacterized protein
MKFTPGAQIFREMQEKSRAQRTVDGFQNFAAKLGVSAPGEDFGGEKNILSHGQYLPNLMTRNRLQLEYAYRGSWVAGKAIDITAEDMTRAGIEINTNEGAEDIQEFKVQMSRLKIWASLANTIRWGKLYGGCCGVIQIKGQNPAEPLDLDSVGKDQFHGIVVYDRWQLYPVLSELITSGPDMGLPAYYDIVLGTNLNDPGLEPDGQQTTNATGRVRVHHSRCIRVIGYELPFWQAITEMMWGESILERTWDRLIEYDDAIASVGSLMNRAQLRTVSIDQLRNILASGGEAEKALIAQFAYMRQFQSSEGLTLLDKEDVFQSVAYSFGGVADTLLQFKQEIGGAFDIPLVRFFGQSPAGLNATGESDLRLYYDGINAKQEYQLRNPVEMVLKVMWRSCFGKPVPKDLVWTFTSLWQMSDTEKATIAKSDVDTLIEAHEAGGITTAVMMKEFKKLSNKTGLFTHITEEEIEEAENDEPPMPEEAGETESQNQADPGTSASKPAGNKNAPKNPSITKPAAAGSPSSFKEKSKDSAWKRIKGWLSKDKKTQDPGIKGTIQEFEKGTLHSSSGAKVTSKKQALAIGYSEEGKDSKITDAQRIKDWLKKNG